MMNAGKGGGLSPGVDEDKDVVGADTEDDEHSQDVHKRKEGHLPDDTIDEQADGEGKKDVDHAPARVPEGTSVHHHQNVYPDDAEDDPGEVLHDHTLDFKVHRPGQEPDFEVSLGDSRVVP
mmetsp:Transcript_111175/g.166536  ORF Transcript_111175/g.166536 Transcript_111175/m.166536 type:complete len:121 (+) Transcript_111175:2043-2405(+)